MVETDDDLNGPHASGEQELPACEYGPRRAILDLPKQLPAAAMIDRRLTASRPHLLAVEGMTKIAQSVDDGYSGTYRGHGFTVRRELMRGAGKQGGNGKVWVARCGALVIKAPWYANSRAHAVRELQRELDRATVELPPEFAGLLHRWAEEIEALKPNLDPCDPRTAFELKQLQIHFRHLEDTFRRETIVFRERLACLNARAARPADAKDRPVDGSKP
jgi:hypothetical protein